MSKKALKYLGAHPYYNSLIHILLGAGLGILVTYPLIGEHPVRWAAALVGLGILGHLYPLTLKKV